MDHSARSSRGTTEVLNRYREALWRLTAGYARQPADREDLFQEILLALWQALPSFRGECSERTFVYRVAHNRGISYRSRARRQGGPSIDEIAAPTATTASPEGVSIAQAEQEALRRAVLELPLSYREVVLLRLEGLSSRQIADVVGITTNNVDVRLSRARDRLRETMLEAGTS